MILFFCTNFKSQILLLGRFWRFFFILQERVGFMLQSSNQTILNVYHHYNVNVVWRDCLSTSYQICTFCLNLFGMQGLIWMRFKMRFSNELCFSERLDKKLLTSSWQIWIFFMNVRNFWDFVQFLWPSYKVRTLLTYQQYNVNVEWLSIKFNISSVVEFQRWWVL